MVSRYIIIGLSASCVFRIRGCHNRSVLNMRILRIRVTSMAIINATARPRVQTAMCNRPRTRVRIRNSNDRVVRSR